MDGFFELFPSTQDLLSNFSDMLAKSASHYLYDSHEASLSERIKLAYADHSRVT